MDQIDRLPRPRHVDYIDTLIGGIPAIVATPTAVAPVRHLLYIHGGAYVVGSPKSHIAMVANLAKRASATATVIEYRLAPEHVYPAAIDDCVAAYRALINDVDPATVTIAGDSAGGGATLSTLVALRDAGDPLPAAAYLLSPWTDLTGSGESVITRAAADPMIDGAKIAKAGRVYAGDVALDDPGVSPLFADLAGLPPMLIQTGMDEVLLSDSTRLADRAREAGVEVTLDLAEGMWHVYPSFARMMPEATNALVRAAVFMRSRTPATVTV
ncbi:MAG TPA: alpha/beta hydrolase [Ilumatobacteraceae bacterium]|nr:alpha/beta hydrolase [Ilumatobacteraceae bacterium]